MTYETN